MQVLPQQAAPQHAAAGRRRRAARPVRTGGLRADVRGEQNDADREGHGRGAGDEVEPQARGAGAARDSRSSSAAMDVSPRTCRPAAASRRSGRPAHRRSAHTSYRSRVLSDRRGVPLGGPYRVVEVEEQAAATDPRQGRFPGDNGELLRLFAQRGEREVLGPTVVRGAGTGDDDREGVGCVDVLDDDITRIGRRQLDREDRAGLDARTVARGTRPVLARHRPSASNAAATARPIRS